MSQILTHTLPNGRLFRGCQALHACRELLPSATEEAEVLGKPLACAIELVRYKTKALLDAWACDKDGCTSAA